MKPVFIVAVSTIIFASVGCSRTQPESRVDLIMQGFADGKFERDDEIRHISGWTMTTMNGQEISRSTLQYNAKRLVKLGPTACNDILDWLEHPQIEVRYIASYSLQEMIGEKIGFPNFAELQQIKSERWSALFKDKVADFLGRK